MMSLNLSDNGNSGKTPTTKRDSSSGIPTSELGLDSRSVKTFRQSYTSSWLRDWKHLDSGQSTTDAESLDSLLPMKSGPSTIVDHTISEIPVLRPDISKFACPFAVRNPVRFNIRDHRSCVLSGFESIATLKYVIRLKLLRSWNPKES